MNRFSRAETVEEAVFQAIGAGSVCWENPGGAGVFDSTEAKKVGDDAMERLRELVADVLKHDHRFIPVNHSSIGSEDHCGCGFRPRGWSAWAAHVAEVLQREPQPDIVHSRQDRCFHCLTDEEWESGRDILVHWQIRVDQCPYTEEPT